MTKEESIIIECTPVVPQNEVWEILPALAVPVVAEPPAPTVEISPLPFLLPANGVELEAVEMSLVEQALKRCHGNQTRAAELLGISRDQLRYRLKKLEGAAIEASV